MDQCRQVADNRREKEDVKKLIPKKKYTRKVRLQLKLYKDFDRCINSMKSLSSYTIDEIFLIELIQKLSNTVKDSFVQYGGK